MDLQVKVRKSRKKKVEVTKLLFLAMDGSGANSWDDLEAFYDSCFKKGLSYDETKEMYDREFRSGSELIFPEKARLVTEIIEKTGAKIIWSSSWRNWFIYKDIEQARKMMLRRGMPGNALIAYTNDFYIFGRRAEEIATYLRDNYPECDTRRCAILDADEDACFDERNFIEFGYTPFDVDFSSAKNEKYASEMRENCRFFLTDCKCGLTQEIANEIIEYLNADM